MATSGPITYLVMDDQFPSGAAPRERLPQSTGMSSPLIGMSAKLIAVKGARIALWWPSSLPGFGMGRSGESFLVSSLRWLVWRGWEVDTDGHDGVVDAGGVHQPA